MAAHAVMWSISRWWRAWQPGTTHSVSRATRAVRWAAVTVRPRWATVRMSVPLVTTAARKASLAMARAVATGMGPAPSSSQVSPSMVWPRARAVWSTRTMTCAGGRRPSPSPARARLAASAMAMRASAAWAAWRSRGAGGRGLVFERLKAGAEAGQGVGGEAGVDAPGAVPVDPGAQRPGPVHRLVAALLVGGVGRGAARRPGRRRAPPPWCRCWRARRDGRRPRVRSRRWRRSPRRLRPTVFPPARRGGPRRVRRPCAGRSTRSRPPSRWSCRCAGPATRPANAPRRSATPRTPRPGRRTGLCRPGRPVRLG